MLIPNATKVTFSLQCLGYGWTITLFQAGVSSGFATEKAKANALSAKINSATNKQTSVQYIRLQNAGVQRQGLVVPALDEGPTLGEGVAPQAAAFLRLYNDGNTASKLIFFRGLTTDAQKGGGRLNTGSQFATRIGDLIAQLVSDSWCWAGKDPASLQPQQVSAVAANVNGFPQITFAAPVFAFPVPAGQKKAILTLSGLKGSDTLNGTWVVFPTSATACTFEKQVLFNPWLTPSGFGHSNGAVLYPIKSGLVERFAERKAGRPLYLSRGRSGRRKVVF